ncbi:DHA2 family efflux MFS transporter permease subunit [Saccharothrix obliqua]|uniref:DHA2 family efflux MFS transporter permease subunit n=1 Tax=Saccharothrix obliqua TaxID=2861747 RepID=UPI001C5DEB77|nr:DHA2 family efflux MFS transporter permease subunit [Saccharothrix obliqua]MBW4720499.1 DHA2 family efflux MFS transporter permease subunit [Saccharothrix obliqua]
MTSVGVPDAVTSPPALSRSDRTLIGVLLVATFVVILNETIMGVALPVLLEELHVTAAVGQWLTAGFLLTMSVVIPVTGYLIQQVPTRVLYGVAMTLFSTGTLIAAVAPGFAVLLAGRVVQACGTAIMLPLLMTTVMTLVPPARRGAVMGNISIVISVAPAIGPTVSGVVLDLFGWRAMFWVVLPIAVAALLLGVRRVTRIGEPTGTPIDVVSVVLSVFGFGGLVYGLSSIGHAGGTSSAVLWVSLAVGVAGVAAFVLRQVSLQRRERALLDLRTFAFRMFTFTSVLMMVMMALLLGAATVLPIYLQSVLRFEPLTTGLLMLPGGLLMGLLSPFVGRLYDRVGPRPLLVVGTIATSASLWFAAGFDTETPGVLVLAFHLALSFGLAFSFTPLFSSGLGALPARLYSHGSAIFSTTQQLAAAAGVALLVSVMSARAADLGAAGEPAVAAEMGGVHAAFLLAAVLSLLTVAGAFTIRRGKTADGPVDAHV